MSIVKISDEAYSSLKNELKANNINTDTLRIFLSNMGCSGPVFNLAVDDKNLNDVSEKVHDTTFIVEGKLFQMFKGFYIFSSEENKLDGFSIVPFEMPESLGCSGCCGGCGSSCDDDCK